MFRCLQTIEYAHSERARRQRARAWGADCLSKSNKPSVVLSGILQRWWSAQAFWIMSNPRSRRRSVFRRTWERFERKGRPQEKLGTKVKSKERRTPRCGGGFAVWGGAGLETSVLFWNAGWKQETSKSFSFASVPTSGEASSTRPFPELCTPAATWQCSWGGGSQHGSMSERLVQWWSCRSW